MTTKSWQVWFAGAALALLVAARAPQEPQPKPQEPKPAPAQQAEEQKEPVQPPHSPLEGVYELRRRVVENHEEVRPSRGYLVFSRRHMFLTVIAPAADGETPLCRSSVRGWRVKDDQIETEIRLGYLIDDHGQVQLEHAGDKEVRRIAVARGTLTIYQDDYSFLEFERVE